MLKFLPRTPIYKWRLILYALSASLLGGCQELREHCADVIRAYFKQLHRMVNIFIFPCILLLACVRTATGCLKSMEMNLM